MRDVVDTNAFIREPVYDICKQLKNSDKNKIILSGGRGVGKTTVLKNIEKESLGSNIQTIYSKPNESITFSNNPNDKFNKEFFNHYYEVVMTDIILSYLRKYYSLSYNKYFKDEDFLMDNLIMEVKDSIKSGSANIRKTLFTKELSSALVKKVKEVLKLEKLSLIIDRFDHINGTSNYTQKLLLNYFDLFDKVYLTTDDSMITMKKRNLENKGFYLQNIDYGTDKEILKEIITKRIELYNEEYNKNINIDLFTSDNMIDLYLNEESNIKILLDAIISTKDIINPNKEEIMKQKINDKRVARLVLNKNAKSPTLYI